MPSYELSPDLENLVSDLRIVFNTIGQTDTIRAALVLAEVISRFVDKNQKEKILTVVDFRDGNEIPINLAIKRN